MDPMQPQRILLDTDPGIDDAFAILLALASPEVRLEGVSVTGGNCALEAGVQNALKVLELARASQVPVAAGIGEPLVRPPLAALEVHGNSGLGYAQLPPPQARAIDQHAVDFLIERILAAPGEITLVAVAPLTNLAFAIRREPAIVRAVHRVIVMGGALSHAGNVTPLAEFNTYVDPHAAHVVFHSGMPITLVPLDVTTRCRLTMADVEPLLEIPSPISRFLVDAARFYVEFNEAHGEQGCALHDPLAVAVAFLPELVQTKRVYVDVDIYSEMGLGNTVADFHGKWGKPPNVDAALEVDARRVVELFLRRMKTLAESVI
jgi:purine nucleosidase